MSSGTRMKTGFERRERKNSQNRARSKALKERVAATKLKPRAFRTEEEELELQEYEERRRIKNNTNRRRLDLQKGEVERILAIPPFRRSSIEADFLAVQMKRKFRKNEGDRIRRLRTRHGYSDDQICQAPMPMSRHASSTAFLQQRKQEVLHRKTPKQEEQLLVAGEKDQENGRILSTTGEDSSGSIIELSNKDVAHGAQEGQRVSLVIPPPEDNADENGVFQQGGVENAHASSASLNSAVGGGGDQVEGNQATMKMQATAEELIRDFELENDATFGTEEDELETPFADLSPAAPTMLPLDSMQPHGGGRMPPYLPNTGMDFLAPAGNPVTAHAFGHPGGMQLFRGFSHPSSEHPAGTPEASLRAPPRPYPRMPIATFEYRPAGSPQNILPRPTAWKVAPRMHPSNVAAPFLLPPPHLMHHYYNLAPSAGAGRPLGAPSSLMMTQDPSQQQRFQL